MKNPENGKEAPVVIKTYKEKYRYEQKWDPADGWTIETTGNGSVNIADGLSSSASMYDDMSVPGGIRRCSSASLKWSTAAPEEVAYDSLSIIIEDWGGGGTGMCSPRFSFQFQKHKISLDDFVSGDLELRVVGDSTVIWNLDQKEVAQSGAYSKADESKIEISGNTSGCAPDFSCSSSFSLKSITVVAYKLE